MSRGRLLILGFGGHARSVADIALSAGFESLLFVDDNARPDLRRAEAASAAQAGARLHWRDAGGRA